MFTDNHETLDGSALTGYAFVGIAGFAGMMTWLCVGWFGNHTLLTALMAVVLVELFLASFGIIAMLLTERMTVKLLEAEKCPARQRHPQPKRDPVWLRLHEPAPGTPSSTPQPVEQTTLAFPTVDETADEDASWWQRPAA